MKTPTFQTDRIFRDRHLSDTPRTTRRYASLDLSGLDQTDFTDSVLRVFLVVCLMVSMLVCGREWSAASQSAATPVAVAATGAQPTLHAQAAPVPSAIRCVL